MIKEEIIKALKKTVEELGIIGVEPTLEHPSDEKHGDYSSNVALVAFGRGKGKGDRGKWKNSMELAQQIAKPFTLHPQPYLDKVEIAPPGFINFWLSRDYLISQLKGVLDRKEKYGWSTRLRDASARQRKIMVEFAHPNTHKLFHIGHLRNITLGEVISRLLESQGVKVIRTNYQGDVGLHIAKALWGVRKLGWRRPQNLDEKVKFLSQAYVAGNKAYEEKEQARQEIEEVNRNLYQGKQDLVGLWEETRNWSLDYFERIYKRVGTKFDRLYFESEVVEPGKEIVLKNLNKVFLKDEGAIIFPGKKYGLHNRVFINRFGLPTYEGKDMGLAKLEFEEFSPERIIHVVGPEQKGYFEVIFKALEILNPDWKSKEYHLLYGLVRLKEGKMSSRTGEIVEGEWLLDEAKRRIKKQFSEMDEKTAEKVAVGAVKYSMLKFSTASDISFSFEESISLEGNSGPYLQYTFARTQSVLRKAKISNFQFLITNFQFEPEELVLLRMLHRFPEVIEEAAKKFAPNIVCDYLFTLAQAFNLFYQKNPIIKGGEKKEFRLALTVTIGQILKSGLNLLGIEAPKRM